MICPDCGNEIKENETICKGCGQSVFVLKQKLISKQDNDQPQIKASQLSNSQVSNSTNQIVADSQIINTNFVCPNCGNVIKNNETICKGCGQSVLNLKKGIIVHENKQNLNKIEPSKGKQPEEQYEYEKYLETYIGQDYSSLKQGGFSFTSFFGIWYWSYRRYWRMVIEYSILSYLILNVIPFVFILIFYLGFPIMTANFSLIGIITGVLEIKKNDLLIQGITMIGAFALMLHGCETFNKRYIDHCKEKVSKIVKENKGTEAELINTLKSKGNPSIRYLIIMVLITIVVCILTFILKSMLL